MQIISTIYIYWHYSSNFLYCSFYLKDVFLFSVGVSLQMLIQYSCNKLESQLSKYFNLQFYHCQMVLAGGCNYFCCACFVCVECKGKRLILKLTSGNDISKTPNQIHFHAGTRCMPSIMSSWSCVMITPSVVPVSFMAFYQLFLNYQ